METWVLRCKLYPVQHRVWDNRLARPSPRGGLIPRAIAGLDRWLSRQNPAYRPALLCLLSPRKPALSRGPQSLRFYGGPIGVGRGGISLLHLSWGCPRRVLPVILALRSPDFPHLGPFGSHPRLSDLVAALFYSMEGELSNTLQNLFERAILKKKS